MSETSPLLDWTAGAAGIVYQVCAACSGSWYFRRRFCPRCGAAPVQDRQATGLGTVHARTLVARAPSEELRSYAPYLIVLVDADEGFRLMAHGDPALEIGDRVRARFSMLADLLIPYFEKADA
jgi:uncharacterized OB-fold protein